MKLSEKIGEKIVEQRKQKKLTQKQLATALNVSPQLISKWENGEASPSVEYLIELAKFFDVSINYFIEDKQTQTQEATPENKKIQEKQKFSLKQFLLGLPKWIYWLVFSVVGAMFVAGIVCLSIFSIVPAVNRDNYISQINDCVENYLKDNYFNIEVVGESDDSVVLTQNYKAVIENGNVSYELYQEDKSPKLMINNVHFEPATTGYHYKENVENVPTSVQEILSEIAFAGDVDYSDITKEDIKYIRKIGDNYILNLNLELVKKEMSQSMLKQIEFKGGLNGEIKTKNDKIEEISLKTKIYVKDAKRDITISSVMKFIPEIPQFNENAYSQVAWKVDGITTEEYILNQFYNNNISKVESTYPIDFEDILSASKNNRAYFYGNKYVYVKYDQIYVFDLQTKQLQKFQGDNQSGFFHDKYYICWDTYYIYKFNIETNELTKFTKSAEEVDHYQYYVYQDCLVFYEEYELFEYRYVIYNIKTDKLTYVNIGDYIAKYPSSYTYFRDNIMYYCYLSYNSCDLYKYDIITGEKTYISWFNPDNITGIKYISTNHEVYYDKGSKIYKLGSSFAYEYGDLYEENGKICVKTSEYVFVYQNEELLEVKPLQKQNSTNDIYSDSNLISYDDKNIYIKDRGCVYHGSYENYSSILEVYCEGVLLYPTIQDAKSGQILAYEKTYDYSVGANVEFFAVYDVTDLTKPKLLAKLNSKTSTFEFKKIKLSESIELLKIYDDIYLVQK